MQLAVSALHKYTLTDRYNHDADWLLTSAVRCQLATLYGYAIGR
jgi:hypothetical protein